MLCIISVDGRRLFSDRGAPPAPALAEPVERGAPWPYPLEDGAYYVIEFPSDHPRDGAERMPMLYSNGHWFSVSDGDMGGIPVEVADYKVVAKLDLWAD
jgi:hypothetical protein